MAKKNGHYEIPLKFTNAQRAAHYLDWKAQHSPGANTAFNELLKAITGVARMPQLKSQEVEHLRKNTHAIRKVLFEKYGREIISHPGVGIRASIDDADVLKNVVPKKAGRLESARKGFLKTTTKLDTSSIPDTEEMRPLKGWLQREAKDVIKQLSSPEFMRKLLPPTSVVEGTPKK